MSVRAVAGGRAIVWVEGPDAASFLHGLLSNDVAALGRGETCRALLLDAKGHVHADVQVVRTGDGAFTLLTGPESGERLANALDRYHFSEDVEIIGPESTGHITFLATGVVVPGAEFVLPGRIPGTVEAIGDDTDALLAAAGAEPADPDTLEAERVAAGVGVFGIDFDERTLVHEAGLQATAVSFHKGCYLGQETVARVEYRGGVNRRLVGLRLPEAVRPGTSVRRDGRDVGRVTSATHHPRLGEIGLAMLRREVADGDEVALDGVDAPARVVALPLLDEPATTT